ncbi:hypothetical protein LCGC14_2347670 [marine sediment metagenome]|uniref:DUF2321 domain-containing protein n=1 Tax=marine sediment metagenome TaxID=412755 RepID=A0A0F9EMS0_9ZZZZ
MVEEGYDTAQVCRNGHVVNDMAATYPDYNQEFCETCGEATITACPQCNSPIRGHYHARGVFDGPEYHPPAYCHNCGKPFPWAERALQAAIEMAIESGDLDADEQQQFRESVQEVAQDTPTAQLAGSRIARLLKKMGRVTGSAIRDILVDIASESAKKMIWPDK